MGEIYAIEHGQGLPIILLHGGLATHVACLRFALPLAERFRLSTPDLRGSGRSHFAGELSWELLADDVAQLAPGPCVVGGISFGAGVAVKVALRHPSLVRGLVLLHPAYGGDELGLLPAQRAAMDAMHAAGERTLTDGIAALHPLLDTLPPELRARARQLVAEYDPASVAATTRFMASGVQPFARADELAAIAAPALVVPGIDPQHPREVAELFARALPRCTQVDTSDFARAIDAFVQAALGSEL